ncbi:MAG: hypothetical protein WC483_00020 [Candidatus Paceibacterota bacterium]
MSTSSPDPTVTLLLVAHEKELYWTSRAEEAEACLVTLNPLTGEMHHIRLPRPPTKSLSTRVTKVGEKIYAAAEGFENQVVEVNLWTGATTSLPHKYRWLAADGANHILGYKDDTMFSLDLASGEEKEAPRLPLCSVILYSNSQYFIYEGIVDTTGEVPRYAVHCTDRVRQTTWLIAKRPTFSTGAAIIGKDLWLTTWGTPGNRCVFSRYPLDESGRGTVEWSIEYAHYHYTVATVAPHFLLLVAFDQMMQPGKQDLYLFDTTTSIGMYVDTTAIRALFKPENGHLSASIVEEA